MSIAADGLVVEASELRVGDVLHLQPPNAKPVKVLRALIDTHSVELLTLQPTTDEAVCCTLPLEQPVMRAFRDGE